MMAALTLSLSLLLLLLLLLLSTPCLCVTRELEPALAQQLTEDRYSTTQCHKLQQSRGADRQKLPQAGSESIVSEIMNNGNQGYQHDRSHNGINDAEHAPCTKPCTAATRVDKRCDKESVSQGIRAVQNVTLNEETWLPHYRSISAENDRSSAKVNMRPKRFILFDNGGIIKLVLGMSFPIEPLSRLYTLSYVYNIQLQYIPPPRPIYWWSAFNSSSFAARHRRQLEEHTRQHDHSRAFVYNALEGLMQRSGVPGEACLLRAICEVANDPFPFDVQASAYDYFFHGVLNAILTPLLPNINAKYLRARRDGLAGQNCAVRYRRCPTDKYFLQKISIAQTEMNSAKTE